MKDKITLKKFFESNEKLAIHCDTEEKANKLLKEFDRLGKKWNAGASYLDYNNYEFYKDKTCYSNHGGYCELESYKDKNYKIYSFKDIIFEEEAKPKNLIPEIAKMLGVEIGEKFKISKNSDVFEFTKDKLIGIDSVEVYNAFSIFFELITGKKKIIKLPPKSKPILTEDEKVTLRNLPRKYKYIARDSSGALFVYGNKPEKGSNVWIGASLGYFNSFKHLFQFIKWEDEEAYNIEELLKE